MYEFIYSFMARIILSCFSDCFLRKLIVYRLVSSPTGTIHLHSADLSKSISIMWTVVTPSTKVKAPITGLLLFLEIKLPRNTIVLTIMAAAAPETIVFPVE